MQLQTSQAGSFGRHLKEAPWLPRIDDNNDDGYDESKNYRLMIFGLQFTRMMLHNQVEDDEEGE